MRIRRLLGHLVWDRTAFVRNSLIFAPSVQPREQVAAGQWQFVGDFYPLHQSSPSGDRLTSVSAADAVTCPELRTDKYRPTNQPVGSAPPWARAA